MNEFIEQFLLESRELVEQATDDLLALEERPDDSGRLDSAFRAFHTLKGAAGIVDFAAMARALHAAEDVLGTLRTGAQPLTPRVISDCLTCLDQVVRWLDTLQADGEQPREAEASADIIVRRFAAEPGVERSAEKLVEDAVPSGDWLGDLIGRHALAAQRAVTAVRYTPDVDCFFRGEDPLAFMAKLPGMLALELAPAKPAPDVSDLDPFSCQLVLSALVSDPADEVGALLLEVGNQVEILAAPSTDRSSDTRVTLPSAARSLLEDQILLLAEKAVEGAAGRLASAGQVSANVLRHVGRGVEAARLERELAKSQAAGHPRFLIAAVDTVLHGILNEAIDDVATVAQAPQEAPARDLRVNVERIDALVRLTGELTVAKNSIGHIARQAQNGGDPITLAGLLKDRFAHLDRLIGELQGSVLTIRVLPLRHVFQRFPRLVRDLATGLGRPARLVTEGGATEADKALVESLFEPLLHVLRNAIDHGLESAQERSARGKPPTATITLRAARHGESVVVEVEDDGRGIDLDRIRRVAADRRVAPPEILAALTDDEVVNLIFAPGFSTAAEITDLSGRGVGMDAVRTAVERLGGRVTVESRPERGSIVRFILPFTIMMTRVMTVSAGGQMFGLPLDAVQETVRVARNKISPIGAGAAFVLRNRTIPLINLPELLGSTGGIVASEEATVVIAAMGGQVAGLEVERLGERMDVMLKPMDGLLSGTKGIAGTTVLGDGRVLIVLDLHELLQ